MRHSEVANEIRGVVRDVVDRGSATWQACADAGLLGLAVPEEHGGAGLGVSEWAVAVDELSRRAIDLPILETMVGAALISAWGSAQTRSMLLARIIEGELAIAPLLCPQTGDRRGSVTRLHPQGATHTWLLVSAHEDSALLLIPADADGVTLQRNSSGQWVAAIDPAAEVGAEVLSDQGADVAAARDWWTAGLLIQGNGLVAGARDLTADYIKEREQFGRVLAQFQAVAMQMADVFIQARLLDLVVAEVVRRLDVGEDAADDLAIAAYWFAEHAPTALQTCHHLHGGFGVDQTYALHRYFGGVKDVAQALGGRAQTLSRVPAREAAASKNLELTQTQRGFKAEVRDYFETLLSRADRIELLTDRHGPAYHRSIRQMGADGWMGVGWPREYGGHGLGGIEQQIFANEAARNDVFLPAVTLQTVGPTLQRYGTAEQKDLFLKRILAGDVHFAIGYSEAEAGTDLASLRCSAKQDANGDWIVNGEKMWTTGGHAADYIWLAVRTDPDAPKHKGISILIVDTKDPGFSWTPIITCDGSHHVNATSYADVRVPASMVVGGVNEGWKLITTQLNHERIMLGPAGRLEGLRDQVLAWADDSAVELSQWSCDVFRRTTAAMRVNELLNWAVAGADEVSVADASASKVFSSDVVQQLGLDLEEVVRQHGNPADPETAYLLDYLDRTSKRNLVLTFGGGVNEVQRELICMFGLGLPRVPR